MAKLDTKNYRKHSEHNQNLIRKSLENNGAGRSIVTDAEGNIIGGCDVIIKRWQNLTGQKAIRESDKAEYPAEVHNG